MDTSDWNIEFDENGVCNHCRDYFTSLDTLDKRPIEEIWSEIKERATGKYDGILGISGGTDSCWVAYLAKKAGLNLLLVHVDDGFNTDAAVKNIEATAKHTGFDIEYRIVPQDEMIDVIRAYFKAGVIGLESPSDNVYRAINFKTMEEYDIKNILHGGNYQTEKILPSTWGYDNKDATNIRAIHKEFGIMPLKKLSLISFYTYVRKLKFGGIREYRPLYHTDYNRRKAIDTMVKEWGWIDYGRKHNEARYTKFIECYVFPKRFGFDKRLPHYSTLICSGQMTRDEAMHLLETEPLYTDDELKVEKEFVLGKLGFSEEEFEELMALPVKSNLEFKTNKSKQRIYKGLRKALRKFT